MSSLSTVLNVLSMVVMLVLLIGGAVLMAVRRREHGRASMIGLAGCVVLLLGVVINGVFIFMAPSLVDSFGPGGYEPFFVVFNLVTLVVQVVGTGLLIFAVIARRNPAAPAPQGPWQPQTEWQQQPPYQQQQPYQQQPGWQTPPQPPFGGGQG